MSDILLTEFFSKQRWETALDTAVEKKLNRSLLKQLCEPDKRIALLNDIASGTYRIQPPHTAKIPKDNGDFRTVYINCKIAKRHPWSFMATGIFQMDQKERKTV